MSPLPEKVNADAVAWITSNALALLEDQQRRAESLQTRAAQIAGFAGATVALSAPLGPRAFKELDGIDEAIAAVFYFGGVAALTLTIIASVVFVLMPVQHYAVGATEIRHYVTDRRFVTQTPAEIQFRTIKAVEKAVARYEKVNSTKATWLKVTAILFLSGLLLTVAVATTVAAAKLCA